VERSGAGCEVSGVVRGGKLVACCCCCCLGVVQVLIFVGTVDIRQMAPYNFDALTYAENELVIWKEASMFHLFRFRICDRKMVLLQSLFLYHA